MGRRFKKFVGLLVVFFCVAVVIGYVSSDASSGETIQIELLVVEKQSNPDLSASEETGDTGESNQEHAAAITVPEEEETVGVLVWVPTNGGTKYHSNAGCSNMSNPIQVSVETAEANGFGPCKRCH